MDKIIEESIIEELLSSSTSSSSLTSSSSSSLSMSSSSSSSSESSDSSMDLDDEDLDDEVHSKFVKHLFHRESKKRVSDFVTNVVRNYSDEEFRRNFRLSRGTVNILVDMYKSSIYFKKQSGGRKAVSAEIQCLAFLWFSGNKETYREVSNLFDIAPSAAHSYMTKLLEFLFEISPQIIKFPTTDEEKEQKSKEFQEVSGFPDVLGCIDGSYIYIRKPAHKVRSTYVNRHGLISISLQGICDANKNFLDAFVGCPSKIHDSRVFKLSFISKKLPDICGKKYHLLGDAAYPLREFLLTPFKDYGNLDSKKNCYNKKHNQTRVKIENTFGLLKQRFRQLIRLDFFTMERMSKFIFGCCVLHNLCIENGDLWDDDVGRLFDNENVNAALTEEVGSESLPEAVLKVLGETKRDHIMNTL